MSQKKLHEEIIARSEADEWEEARDEWTLHDIWMSDEPQTCLCGHHPIHEICVIRNRENGVYTDVGNWCVNNFLGINSEQLFSSLRKVLVDAGASFNEATIELAHDKEIVNDWERRFYLSIWRKRSLTGKQREKKLQINQKLLKRFTK